jgi:transcriptional regulator with XRE-family HTH domain
MATKFSELRSKMTPRTRTASEREYRRLAEAMPLQKLRHARNFTQQGLAKVLRVTQSEVSKIENRADVYVSTLSSYVEAMGGQLEIRAIFPEGKVRINQFDELSLRISAPPPATPDETRA